MTRPTVVFSGVASLIVDAIAGVGDADTTASSLTVLRVGCTRRTTDFTVGALEDIALAQDCCPFGLRARVVPDSSRETTSLGPVLRKIFVF